MSDDKKPVGPINKPVFSSKKEKEEPKKPATQHSRMPAKEPTKGKTQHSRMGGVVPKRTSKPAAPKKEYIAEHTVEAGETLSDISLKYYKSAVKDKYMVIYEENKAVIGDNPNLIKPGQVFKIPKL